MAEVWRYFAHEDDYPDLDGDAACRRLGDALAIPTVDGPSRELTDWAAFDRLEGHLHASFPLTFAAATAERVDHSLLLTLPGSDPSLDPALFMGHVDVVPVVPGTEGDWTHGAFSGHVDGEYVWGRGALDMTEQVVGYFESIEYALSHGWALRRTLLVALGQDEETLQSGARRMGALLAGRGIRLAWLVDEGDYRIVDTGLYGAPGHHGMRVSLAEKGYADLRLTVRSHGGHSSNPFGGSSLATLGETIARVARDPWPVELTELSRRTLEAVAPWVSQEPLASLVRSGEGEGTRDAIDRNADAIARLFLGSRELFPLVTTTVAPTMIEGGSKQANVLPQDMSAVVNFRMLPGVTCAAVVARVRELLADLPVEVELLAEVSNSPSQVSRSDGPGFRFLERVAARYFREPESEEPLKLIPAIVVGASDAQMYDCVCDSCLRFSPFVADDEEVERGVHGTDERITRRAYLQGVRFLIGLIREALL